MSIQDIRDFLIDFKKIATSGSGIDIVPRQDALATLAQLGLTKANLEQILLGLSVSDYSKGPEPDRDRPGKLWMFGTVVDGHEVYIKLKIVQVGEKKLAKCISFHVAQHPLRYPHR